MVAPIGKPYSAAFPFGSLMTLFLMPVIYAIFNKRADQRKARAEARRERIAAGLSRKQAQEAKNDTTGTFCQPLGGGRPL